MQTRKQTKENNVSVYRGLTHKIVEKKPLNSGSNIAREIYGSSFSPFDHAEGTIVNYVREILKEDFEVIDRQWCKIDYSTNTY